jgi:hypothetical protein
MRLAHFLNALIPSCAIAFPALPSIFALRPLRAQVDMSGVIGAVKDSSGAEDRCACRIA